MSLTKPLTFADLARLFFLTAACCVMLMTRGSGMPSKLQILLDEGTLNIVSRNGPTTYYEGRQGLTGFEYSLASEFADYLGVELKIHEEEDLNAIFDALNSGKAHLAASGLTITESRQEKADFAASYLTVNQQLIYRHGTGRPKTVKDLLNKDILVIANSAHADTLQKLQQEYPELKWREQADIDMFDLIEMVNNGEIDYTVVDSNAFNINRNIFPRARPAFDISDSPQKLAWAFPKPQNNDDSIYQAAQRFFQIKEADGQLAQLVDTYFGNVEKVDRRSALVLTRRIEKRLPRYQEYLEEAAKANDIEWELLAAVSYQESHWNPQATSYTGVRGLMMLTHATAREMGVADRTDPKSSIFGGAAYIRKLHELIQGDMTEDDRMWMTLAAYNVGIGHLEDARKLTARFGGNPDSWEDVRKRLPLLAKRKYYRSTIHGYARGWEPVAYVDNIRSYYTVLAWHSQMQARRLALAESDLNNVASLTQF